MVPVPSWPEELSPQQYAAAPVVIPQVYVPPPALSAAKVSPPEMATGVALSMVVPLPS